MNRSTGKAPVPTVATPLRAEDITLFHKELRELEKIWSLRIVADGIEIHDDLVPGTYPAIITESGELELITESTLEEAKK